MESEGTEIDWSRRNFLKKREPSNNWMRIIKCKQGLVSNVR